jgi:hypothetical protein
MRPFSPILSRIKPSRDPETVRSVPKLSSPDLQIITGFWRTMDIEVDS